MLNSTLDYTVERMRELRLAPGKSSNMRSKKTTTERKKANQKHAHKKESSDSLRDSQDAS